MDNHKVNRIGLKMPRSTLIKLAISLAALAIALMALRGVDLAQTAALLLTIDPLLLVAVLAVQALGVVFRLLRWQFLLRPKQHVPLHTLCAPLLISFAVGNVTVTGVGAIPRIELVHRRTGLDRAFIAGAWVLENVLDFAILLLWAVVVPFVVALPQSEGMARFLRIHLLLSLPLGMVLMVILAIWRRHSLVINLLRPFGAWEKLVNRLPWQLGNHLDAFGDGLTTSMREFRACSWAWLTTVAIWALEVLMFWLLMLSLKIDLNPLEASMVTAYTHLVTGIPSVPGFIGTLELSTGGLILMLGGNSVAALAYVILLRLFFIGPTTLAGVIAAGHAGWSLRAFVAGASYGK